MYALDVPDSWLPISNLATWLLHNRTHCWELAVHLMDLQPRAQRHVTVHGKAQKHGVHNLHAGYGIEAV